MILFSVGLSYTDELIIAITWLNDFIINIFYCWSTTMVNIDVKP